jgi:hypothetical protein
VNFINKKLWKTMKMDNYQNQKTQASCISDTGDQEKVAPERKET